MRPLAASLLLLLAAPAPAADTAHHVDGLECASGPYSLQLPESFDALRRIGPLQAEHVLPVQVRGARKGESRELVFDGLRLVVVRTADNAGRYRIASAEVSAPVWRIAGPFRVGGALPEVADVDAPWTRGETTLTELSGERDTIRIKRTGKTVATITYLCYVD
jgi:hypothetical protein